MRIARSKYYEWPSRRPTATSANETPCVTERGSPGVSGAAAALRREPLLPSSFTFPKEHGTMQTVLAPRGDARTFLTHFVGDGLDDDRYVVEKYRSLANGNRRRW